MFPVIPMLSAIAMACGGVSLWWYDRLPREKQEQADRAAANLAMELYQTTTENLTHEQASHVAWLVQSRHAR